MIKFVDDNEADAFMRSTDFLPTCMYHPEYNLPIGREIGMYHGVSIIANKDYTYDSNRVINEVRNMLWKYGIKD